MKKILILFLMFFVSISVNAEPLTLLKNNLNSNMSYDMKLLPILQGNRKELVSYVNYLKRERERISNIRRQQKKLNIFTKGLFQSAKITINKKIILSSKLYKASLRNRQFWKFLDERNTGLLNSILISLDELSLLKQIDLIAYNQLNRLLITNIRKSAFSLSSSLDRKGLYRYVLDVKNKKDFLSKPQVLILDQNSRISVVQNNYHKTHIVRNHSVKKIHRKRKTPQQLKREQNDKKKKKQIIYQQNERRRIIKKRQNSHINRKQTSNEIKGFEPITQNQTILVGVEVILHTNLTQEEANRLLESGERPDDLRYPGPPLH